MYIERPEPTSTTSPGSAIPKARDLPSSVLCSPTGAPVDSHLPACGAPAPNAASGRRFFPQYGLSAQGTLSLLSWVAAVRTLNSIANVLTVPVISALLAQAAVVYTQKRKAEQKLSLRQMFALADRRWSDATVVVEAAMTMGTGIGSRFLWLGMLLVVISMSAP